MFSIITTMYQLGLGSVNPEPMLLPLTSSCFTLEMLPHTSNLSKLCSLSRMSPPTQWAWYYGFHDQSTSHFLYEAICLVSCSQHTPCTLLLQAHKRITLLVRHLTGCLENKDQILKMFTYVSLAANRICVFIKQTTQ